MVRYQVEGRVAPRELATDRSVGRVNQFRPQFLFTFEVIVIKLEFNPHHRLWRDLDGASIPVHFAIPILEMEEDIVTKVLGFNEAKAAFFLDRDDLSQTLALNSKSLLRCVVVRFCHGGLLSSELVQVTRGNQVRDSDPSSHRIRCRAADQLWPHFISRRKDRFGRCGNDVPETSIHFRSQFIVLPS